MGFFHDFIYFLFTIFAIYIAYTTVKYNPHLFTKEVLKDGFFNLGLIGIFVFGVIFITAGILL